MDVVESTPQDVQDITEDGSKASPLRETGRRVENAAAEGTSQNVVRKCTAETPSKLTYG